MLCATISEKIQIVEKILRPVKEDLATLSLCHIPESSEQMNEAFTGEICKET